MGLSILSFLMQEAFHGFVETVAKHKLKRPPCAGIRFRIPGASRDSGWGIVPSNVFELKQSKIEGKQSLRHGLRRATSLCTREA